MNLFEWHSRLVEGAAQFLAFTYMATREEKRGWQPSAGSESRTRSANDQMRECVMVNRSFAAVLRGEKAGDPGEIQSGERLAEEVIASSKDLGQAIRALDESCLGRLYEFSWGKLRGEMLLALALSNISYHTGQICYIQTLYGDETFHVPDGMFGD